MPRESAKRFESWKWIFNFCTVISECLSLLYEEENIRCRLNDNSIHLFPNICSVSWMQNSGSGASNAFLVSNT